MNAQAGRLNYIDWLRVGAMFLLVFYHTGRLFDEPAWHIKNALLNDGINVFNRFLDVWHMPLFFLLAGASVWFALEKRTPGEFTKERVFRLLVPLIFGMLIIIPPQVYIERIFDGDFAGSFLAWYPNTFQGTYSMESNSGNLSWHHLWFMAYLLVFSLILIPAFWYFKNAKGKPLISRISAFLEKPGALYSLAAPLIIINLLLRPIFGYGNQNLISDWANFCFYITIFFYGFLLVSDGRILHVVRSNSFTALIAAAVLTLGIYVADNNFFSMSESVRGPILLVVYAAACWCWLLAIIGLASQALNFGNKVLKYASEAVLPVYILHQTLIIIFGYYIIQWDTPVAAKYFLTIPVVLLASLGIYEITRLTNVTRFLFGIKIRQPKTSIKQPVLKESQS